MTLPQLALALGAELVPASSPSSAASDDPAPALPSLATLLITGVAGIEEAGPTEVAFVANPRYARLAPQSRAAALIVERQFAPLPLPTLRVPDPKYAFSQAVALFHPAPSYVPGIHPTAVIAPSARIGSGGHIGPYVVIGEDCVLGEDCVILAHAVLYPGVIAGRRFFAHAHAVVREGCRLGDDVTLQNGAIVGADGFGFAKNPDGRWTRTNHPRPAVLEDDVEVQANSCIDRAIVGETRIGRGAKIDNLVQVGHACTVGPDTLLCAQVGLAGSTRVGAGVTLAGQVGVAGHLTIGDRAVATAQTGIPSDVAAGVVVSGYPAMENRAWLRMTAAMQRLPELMRRLRLGEAK